MNYKDLEQNIIDMLAEQQLKLGFLRETVRLYYPLSSLNQYSETRLSAEEMQSALDSFSSFTETRLGKLDITHKGERFCIGISPEGASYVHEHMSGSSFLKDFIEAISHHDCTIEQLVSLFKNQGQEIIFTELTDEDFDYMLCFKNGIPDSYRYCIKSEGCHLTYHRFTPADYRELGIDS